MTKRGRPATWGVPVDVRRVLAWGKGKRGVRRVLGGGPVQMVFPLDHLPAYFPDPSRQECFQVRHD